MLAGIQFKLSGVGLGGMQAWFHQIQVVVYAEYIRLDPLFPWIVRILRKQVLVGVMFLWQQKPMALLAKEFVLI